MGICHIWHETAHNCVLLSYRRIRRYSVCRLKRLEACDLSHVRFTNTFTGNGTAVCIDSLPGNEVLDFAGSTFSENEVDIDNKIGHPIDTAKAIFN